MGVRYLFLSARVAGAERTYQMMSRFSAALPALGVHWTVEERR